jgi:hypothetical protein
MRHALAVSHGIKGVFNLRHSSEDLLSFDARTVVLEFRMMLPDQAKQRCDRGFVASWGR